MFYEPIGRLHGLNQMLQAARAAGERVFDILDTPVERRTINGARHPWPPVCGDVVYEHVSFRYAPDKIILKDIC